MTYEPPKTSILGALASWAVPLYVLYAIAGFVFAKKVSIGGPFGLRFQWLDDSSTSQAIDAAFMGALLVALVVAFVVLRRRRPE